MISKKLFFVDQFAIKFLVLLPFTIYHIYLFYIDSFQWVPHIAIVAFFFLGTLSQLIRFKFDAPFFKNPFEVFWDRNLSEYKQLAHNNFVFDGKEISRADLYVILGLIFGAPVAGMIGSIIINARYGKDLFDTGIFTPLLMIPAFGSILLFAVFLPAWKLYKKFRSENNPKPYWYCFSYHTHYSRQNHYYKQSTSRIRKPNLIAFTLCCATALLLVFDIVNNGYYAKTLYSNYAKTSNGYVIFNFISFIEIIFFTQSLSQVLKYHYLDALLADANKMLSGH